MQPTTQLCRAKAESPAQTVWFMQSQTFCNKNHMLRRRNTFFVKNSIFKAKSNQYAFSGYNYAKPTFENSLVTESKDIVMRGPTFGTISGFTKITATDKNSKDTTYKPGDDLSTLSTDSRKVVIESQIHSHCVCGGENCGGGTYGALSAHVDTLDKDGFSPDRGRKLLSDGQCDPEIQLRLFYARRGANLPERIRHPRRGRNEQTDTLCKRRHADRHRLRAHGEPSGISRCRPASCLCTAADLSGSLSSEKPAALTAADRVGIGAEVTNKGVIFGGIFDGAVINDGGTIEGGTFNGRVNLKSGDVIGGIYYGRVTYGGAVIHDSACRYLTFDTDGGSAMACAENFARTEGDASDRKPRQNRIYFQRLDRV